MKTVYSVCGMCGTRCPVAVGVENGEAVWIQGNPHSATGSTLCPRGIAALALEKDSERPQSPLMRVGARGGHKWRAVRWEEALDAVAGKLRAIRDQYGPESVMFSHRGGPFTDLYKAFARGLGTPISTATASPAPATWIRPAHPFWGWIADASSLTTGSRNTSCSRAATRWRP